eukprot:TRINITY_DN2355_c0_g1_i3.p1 TRINITY_DN2355_c0_g1~~TRINITY_DN2355_c0_g1_i3.p1  ORF type:complete len:288 (-),score=49.63 TRINITY_DN2355_c0_g1_i3:216-1079(-)
MSRRPAYGQLNEDDLEVAIDIYLRSLLNLPTFRDLIPEGTYVWELPHEEKMLIQNLAIRSLRYDFPTIRLPYYTLVNLVRGKMMIERSEEEVLYLLETFALEVPFYPLEERDRFVEHFTTDFLALYSGGLINKANEPKDRPSIIYYLKRELERRYGEGNPKEVGGMVRGIGLGLSGGSGNLSREFDEKGKGKGNLGNLTSKDIQTCRETYLKQSIRQWNYELATGTPKKRTKLSSVKLEKHIKKLKKAILAGLDKDFPRHKKRLNTEALDRMIKDSLSELYSLYGIS